MEVRADTASLTDNDIRQELLWATCEPVRASTRKLGGERFPLQLGGVRDKADRMVLPHSASSSSCSSTVQASRKRARVSSPSLPEAHSSSTAWISRLSDSDQQPAV